MYLKSTKFNDVVIKDNGELPIKGNIFLSGYTQESWNQDLVYKQSLDKKAKLVGLKFGGFENIQHTGKLPQLQNETQFEILASYAVPELVKIAKEYPVENVDLKDAEREERLKIMGESKDV